MVVGPDVAHVVDRFYADEGEGICYSLVVVRIEVDWREKIG